MSARNAAAWPHRVVLVAMIAAIAAGCAPAAASPDTASDAPAASSVSTAPPVATASAVVASPRRPTDPPAAALLSDGLPAGVPGELGSYVWGGAGSDAPWLPGAPVTLAAGAPILVRVADPVGVESWTALVAPSTDPTGRQATGAGSGTGAIRLRAPGSGSWTLALQVVFSGGAGDAAYYWRVTVP